MSNGRFRGGLSVEYAVSEFATFSYVLGVGDGGILGAIARVKIEGVIQEMRSDPSVLIPETHTSLLGTVPNAAPGRNFRDSTALETQFVFLVKLLMKRFQLREGHGLQKFTRGLALFEKFLVRLNFPDP